MKLDLDRKGEDQTVAPDRPPRCADYDEDCEDIGKDIGPGDHGFSSHLECYLYDPQCGHCPFLSKP